MSVTTVLAASLKSAKVNLRTSFVLKGQGQLLRQVVEALHADVQSNANWYASKAQQKIVYELQDFLRRLLRFIKINLKITDLVPQGLGELRRARSLCNITDLRTSFNNLATEFQMLIYTSPLKDRLPNVNSSFSGEKVAEAFENDSATIREVWIKTLKALEKSFPRDSLVQQLKGYFVGKLSSKEQLSFDDLNNSQLTHFSYLIENKLFGMATTEPTAFSSIQMDPGCFKAGKFGRLVNGKLGGISMITVQQISKKQLETLSSDGRIRLFATLKSSVVFKTNFLVNIEGVSMHQGSLYVIHEKLHYTLDDLLHGHDSFSPRKFKTNELVNIFLAVSQALEKIHHEGMVHGDVRPSNIFLTRKAGNNGAFSGYAKLGYMNYELNLEELHWSTWADEGLVYQAPEVLSNKKFTAASDMYSAAISLWEAMNLGKKPYEQEGVDGQMVEKIKGGERPSLDDLDGSVDLINLLDESWSVNPYERKTAAEWVSVIKSMVDPSQGGPMNDFINATIKRRGQRKASHKSYSSQGGGASRSTMQSLRNTASRPIPPLNASASPQHPRGSFKQVNAAGTPKPVPPVKPQPPNMFETNRPIPVLPPNPVSDESALISEPSSAPKIPSRELYAKFPGQGQFKDDPPPVEPPRPVQPPKKGNYPREVVYAELSKFYSIEDPDMLERIDELVAWCMENSLEEFNELLLQDFDDGLFMFRTNKAPPGQRNIGNIFGGPPGL